MELFFTIELAYSKQMSLIPPEMKNPCCTVQHHMLVHCPTISWVRASPVVLAMWSCTVKLDEEKPKYAGLAQENALGSAKLHTFSWLVKGEVALCTCRKECNEYNLTATECFSLAHHFDSPRWFAISSRPPIFCPSFSFMGGVGKEDTTKLGCERYFRRVTYWAPLEMLLEQYFGKQLQEILSSQMMLLGWVAWRLA
jgi:hypothetical protein